MDLFDKYNVELASTDEKNEEHHEAINLTSKYSEKSVLPRIDKEILSDEILNENDVDCCDLVA